MNLEPSKETGAEAINSIQHYFSENMPEPIGELAAVRRRVSVLAES